MGGKDFSKKTKNTNSKKKKGGNFNYIKSLFSQNFFNFCFVKQTNETSLTTVKG